MIILFSKYLNSEPTYFKEKIAKSLSLEGINVNYSAFHPFNAKIHTIRRNKDHEIHKGVLLEMMYNEGFEEIIKADCTETQSIFMTFINGQFEVSVEDKCMYYTEINQIAINDGFSGYQSFRDYFISKMNSEGCYSGDIIHWTDFRY